MKQPITIWFTGLSGAGKSTLAAALKTRLERQTRGQIKIFDGDEIRKKLNNDLSFSLADRLENIHRVAEVNNLFLDFGITTINAFISPTDEIRSMARTIIGPQRFFEIYLNTSIEVCMKRDVKGFYKKAKEGQIKKFTGLDSVFEPSQTADIFLDTSQISIDACVEQIVNQLQIHESISNEK